MIFRKVLTIGILLFAISSSHAFAWNNDSCCDNTYISNYTCNSCSCWGAYFVFENVIVRPYFSRNNAYFLEDPNGIDGQEAVMFDWNYQYSPRFELGWINDCGIGLRGRYWTFNNSTTLDATDSSGDIAVYFAEDSAGDGIGFESATNAEFRHKLDIDIVDLEFSFNQCRWTYSAGGRYLHMKQKYKATDLDDLSTRFTAKHDFNGGGLTSAIEYIRPIWCGFAFFTKTRGSLLYGDSDFVAINNQETTAIRSKNNRDILALGELQLGIDWRFDVCDMCSFIRFALETQYWVGGGAAGPGDNAVYDEGNYQNSNPQDANLGFFGFNVAIGLLF